MLRSGRGARSAAINAGIADAHPDGADGAARSRTAELVRKIGRGEYRIAEPFLTEWIRRYES